LKHDAGGEKTLTTAPHTPSTGLAPPEADLDPDDLRCRLTKADCDALGERERREREKR
jgi:hypothetical protein